LMATMFSWFNDPIILSSRSIYARCGWSVSSTKQRFMAYTCLLECRQFALTTAPLALTEWNQWQQVCLKTKNLLYSLPTANFNKIDIAFFRILFYNLGRRNHFSHHFIKMSMRPCSGRSRNRFWHWKAVRSFSCRDPWFLQAR
jgi:hypothetical protein